MQGPKLYGVAEFAEALGWDRSRVSKYLTREAVPEPYARLASGPVWLEEQVHAFMSDGKKISGQEVVNWPVRARRDIPYLLGRLGAVVLIVLETAGQDVSKDMQQACANTGKLGRMVSLATVTASSLGGQGEKLKEVIEEIMSGITEWPDTLPDDQQANWWLGYYHQRATLRK